MNLQGKAAVVSGGASGIGRATLLALVERGAKVVVADIDERRGRETVRTAMDRGGVAMFIRCDVTKSEDLTRAFDSARQNYGRFDIAFNNALVGPSGFCKPCNPAAFRTSIAALMLPRMGQN